MAQANSKIYPSDFTEIKKLLETEIGRRGKTEGKGHDQSVGSMAAYTNNPYGVEPATGGRILNEHIQKIMIPLDVIKGSSDTPADGSKVYAETLNKAAEVLSELSAVSETAAATGCAAQCTGLCSTGCNSACTSCTGSCSTGCSGSCSNSCSSGCSGGCSGSCRGGCRGGCDGCSGGCSGSCSRSCASNCSGRCSGGCSGLFRWMLELLPWRLRCGLRGQLLESVYDWLLFLLC